MSALRAHSTTSNICSEFAGVPREDVDHPVGGRRRFRARCPEQLGEDAESTTAQDADAIRQHAETMAGIVIEMYQEQNRTVE